MLYTKNGTRVRNCARNRKEDATFVYLLAYTNVPHAAYGVFTTIEAAEARLETFIRDMAFHKVGPKKFNTLSEVDMTMLLKEVKIDVDIVKTNLI